MAQTNSIGDQLGIDFDDLETPYDFEGDVTDQGFREAVHDILWDETGVYPPSLDDPIVDALMDDTDHQYRLSLGDNVRTTGVTGIALFAYLDDEVEVEVIDDE